MRITNAYTRCSRIANPTERRTIQKKNAKKIGGPPLTPPIGGESLLGRICNPAVLSISICNAKILFPLFYSLDNGRITNAYTRCSRITNPTEQIVTIKTIIENGSAQSSRAFFVHLTTFTTAFFPLTLSVTCSRYKPVGNCEQSMVVLCPCLTSCPFDVKSW